ncbi:MAG: class I SAM-dependent methyltransferase [Fibromonadales bacterium]|nr:class I SAM-dependent methyltransferase [Fibromonadales bacterium]
MFDRQCIIYGGGQLGAILAACLNENGCAPLFAWDKEANSNLPIKDFLSDVRFPDFNHDAIAKYLNYPVAICILNLQICAEIEELLRSVGFKNIKKFSTRGEILGQFDRKSKSMFSWINKDAAKEYEASTKDVLWSESVVFPLYTRYLEPNSKVLDVGAGQGRLSSYLSKSGFNVMAFDISREQLQYLQKKHPEIDFKVGDAKKLPFEDNSFDAVTSQWFMEHFTNWSEFCSEQLRVCKPGGIVAFDFSFREHYLYAQAALGVQNIEHILQDGAVYRGNKRNNATTYKELSEFCSNNNCTIKAIMPHSFFVLNQFIEGSISREEISILNEYIQQGPLEKNTDIVNILKVYENNIISKLPYWFTRICIIVLKKNNEPARPKL